MSSAAIASVAANAKTHGARGTARGALILGALGVVFGDNGTSLLYTVAAHRYRTSRITADAAEYFGLSSDRTVILGSRIEV